MTEPIHNELHRVSVTGIIWRVGERGFEYLITKRSPEKKAFPGLWTVPGGGLETDDYVKTPPTFIDSQWYNTAEVTLRREIKEEVNLEVVDVKYLLDLTLIRPDGIPVLVLSYYCKYDKGEVELDEDSTESVWVTVDDLTTYELIAGIKEEIEMVEKLLLKD